ncbi:hypothetical protein [Arcobacter caeni]|uniref:Uncharacterized protein n=1 Tax=Arcobacter caeni TaxID=1912877 RepID=A0A363CWD6_9BACT|nr:hypothetical protein [Arcobacter caeni]PUE63408.1 hypothetical protein B0174_11540 [Arcobacter caeni]
MPFYDYTKKKNLKNSIKRICPDVKTIKEVCEFNEDGFNLLCMELKTDEHEYLLTQDEYNYYNSYEYWC